MATKKKKARKCKKHWCVVQKGGRSIGCSKTKSGAKKRRGTRKGKIVKRCIKR